MQEIFIGLLLRDAVLGTGHVVVNKTARPWPLGAYILAFEVPHTEVPRGSLNHVGKHPQILFFFTNNCWPPKLFLST